jgi:PTS system nitrogen regulatory IIA component
MSHGDFDTSSLARYLHLTPTQIERMAAKGQLPARRVGGEWRFSRADIHHWFEERIGLADDDELRQVQRVLESASKAAADDQPADESLAEMLVLEAIAIELPARTRNSAIDEMCRLASRAGVLWDPARMAEGVRNREDLHPTALDNGVALLHPRRPQASLMERPFLALGITAGGIPFGGPRGVLTDVFFLIGSQTERGHLRTLARLSRLITTPRLVDTLRTASDSRDVWQTIHDTEDQIH